MNRFTESVTFVYGRKSHYNYVMNKRPKITEQTRNNLISAFWSLYMKKPLSRISVKEITDLAGYNRATFYHYFTDVPALLEEEETALLEEIRLLFEHAAESDDPRELTRKIGSLLVILRNNNQYASALLSDHGDPQFVSSLKELLWPYINTYLLKTGDCENYEAELIKEFYLSGIFGTVRKWLADPQIEIDELIQLLIRQITHLT